MQNLKDITLKESSSIKDALKVIGHNNLRIALVLGKNKTLKGIVTDADIRHGLLSNLTIDDNVKFIMKQDPITANEDTPLEQIITLASRHNIYEIPILNKKNQVIRVESVAKIIISKTNLNEVVIMAGGLGSRLAPLTNETPKPMLKVGTKPILQTIIERLIKQNFCNFTICINYKGEVIRNYFGDGKKFGANIKYIQEHTRLGTAGALSLIKQKQELPIIVMNADIITDLDFKAMLEFHTQNKSIATMGVREFEQTIPYGVIESKESKITKISEKPTNKFFINAGIYILDPSCINFVPNDEFFDMPTLFTTLIKKRKKVMQFEIDEYWIDIGRRNEYERANLEFKDSK